MLLTTGISWPVIIAGSLGASATIFANVISFVMIGKINERVPESRRISYVWWGTDVRTRFRQLYPENRLVLLLDSCVAMTVLCFIVLMRFWVFG
jgi:hypothetical protein